MVIRGWLERWMVGRAPDLRVRDYLYRWHWLPLSRGGVWKWLDSHVGNVYLHRMRESDDRVPHDHPYANVSIVLAGRLREHWHDGTSTLRRPGAVVARGARTLHWLEVIDGPVWTIFIHGSRLRTWGFLAPEGWVDHRVYLARQDTQEERRGQA